MIFLTNEEITKKLPEYITTIMDRFRLAGEEAYVVGGSLRDIMLSLEPHDFDLATSALPEKTSELFSDMHVIETGLKHGTVTVVAEKNPVEITTFRIDGSYTDSRHPDGVVFTKRIEEDLSRRDFTVNAMAFSPDCGLVDPFFGRKDLADSVLRAVGDPQKRFEEDALRIMRAFRFSAQLGFEIEDNTLLGVYACRQGLEKIARERIASEFIRLLTSDGVSRSLELMIEKDILPFVSADYRPSDKIIEKIPLMPANDISRLGFFLCEATADEGRKILNSLKCSNKQTVGALAVARGSKISVNTPSDARRFIAGVGDYALFAVRASVLMGVSPEDAVSYVENNRGACSVSGLLISGKELIDMGFEGKEIGETLQLLLEAVIEDPAKNCKESLRALAQKIKNERKEK